MHIELDLVGNGISMTCCPQADFLPLHHSGSLSGSPRHVQDLGRSGGVQEQRGLGSGAGGVGGEGECDGKIALFLSMAIFDPPNILVK